MRTAANLFARASFGLAALAMLVASCRTRPSHVPLGGVHVDEQAERDAAKRAAAPKPDTDAPSPLPSATATELAAPTSPVPPPPDDGALAKDAAKPAAAATGATAFVPAPFSKHQSWTRSFDLEFNLKVGPGGNVDMKMVSHQEARFEVLDATNGALDKLGIEYVAYTSKLTIMGATQESPEELAGKRYVVSFARGVPDVRDASGGSPPKKQVDSVKDDAREPLELEKALKELTLLAPKGKADFSAAGAISLAGGQDEDTKVSSAKASLRQIAIGARGDKTAQLDLGYTLTNVLDDRSTIEVQVAGSMSVLDGPARCQTSTLQGPMELRSPDAGGMQGRGTIKVTTSYKY